MTQPDVQVGQIWADNDARGIVRQVKVVSLHDGYAVVINQRTGRLTRIRLTRFRPTSTGYRLIAERQP